MAHRTTVQMRLGFAGVAVAFATALAFTTLPTPLWSLYAHRDGFSSLMITIVFAAYAVGVALSLFLVGHVSDWFGRRRVFLAALALNISAAIVFVAWPALPGLFLARVLSGLGIGAVNATATAWLMELHAGYSGDSARARAEIVATGANLGGLGAGALLSGLLAQWVGHPLVVPYLVLTAGMALAAALVALAPETRATVTPRPRYRPQRVSIPPRSRGRYLAAVTTAAITFSLFGLLSSLAPSFLAVSLHHHSRALAGAVSFSVFASAAIGQALSGSRGPRQLLAAAIPGVLLGLGLLTLAVWLPQPSLAVFLGGVLLSGTASGLMFKGAIGTASALAPLESRAEALAGVFLAGYLGLAGPVIGLGALTQVLTIRVGLLVFAALLAGVLLIAAPRLLADDHEPPRRRPARTAGFHSRRQALPVNQAVPR